jgi:hypothetical protein
MEVVGLIRSPRLFARLTHARLEIQQHANPSHPLTLLGARSKRPCRSTPNNRNEIPPPQGIAPQAESYILPTRTALCTTAKLGG